MLVLFFGNQFLLYFLHQKYDFPLKREVYSSYLDFKSQIDLMVCLGGDGSFLRAVRYIRDSGVPIVGINTGRLGFLSNISKESIAESKVERLL